MLGNAGKSSSNPMQLRPAGELEGEIVVEEKAAASSPGWRPALPTACMRLFTLPEGRCECAMDCVGRQHDGTCLVDVVKAANAAGIQWTFELDSDGVWVYNGPEIPGIDEAAAPFFPMIMNAMQPTDEDYSVSWTVVNFHDATDARFAGTLTECERWIKRL